MDFRSMMALEPHGPDTYVATGPQYPWGGLYGGQIIAQALRAAALTVEPAFQLHSLHAYFIRLGDAAEPIRLEVDRIRNGRSFLTRRVVARQAIGAILTLAASFQIPERGADVQIEQLPAVTPPEALRSDGWSPLIERRLLDADIGPARVGAWMRLTESLGDDPVLNACALADLSDDLPSDAVVAAHPDRPPRGVLERRFWNASLDHAIWFHRPLRADDWHLHDMTCRALSSGRGLATGSVFDRNGHLVATLSQEVLIRPLRG
jgi:acyl-CoA thioesterase-2